MIAVQGRVAVEKQIEQPRLVAVRFTTTPRADTLPRKRVCGGDNVIVYSLACVHGWHFPSPTPDLAIFGNVRLCDGALSNPEIVLECT